MSGKLSSLNRRLAKIERQLIDEARRAELANCICRKTTVADSDKPEEFEAEKNKPCPSHGVRQMGMIVRIEYMGRPDTLKQLEEDLLAGNPSVGRIFGREIRREPPSFSTSSSWPERKNGCEES